jgi:hypothetical protein
MAGKGGISRRGLVIAGATLGAPFRLAAQDRGVETVEIADSETASIDGRIWDKPIVGGKTVDAVHRSVLLRFPAMAEPIAAKLTKGFALPGPSWCWPTTATRAAAPALDRRAGARSDIQCQCQWPPVLVAVRRRERQGRPGTRRWKPRNYRSASRKHASTSPVCF